MSNTGSEFYFELGATGIPWEQARQLMHQAMSEAAEIHSMGAQGRVPVPDSTKVIVYDTGTDGWDSKYFLEEA